MANQRTAVPRPAPGQPCTNCGQQHLTRYGKPACMGHRRFDRTTRERLPAPLPCRNPPRPGLQRCPMHGAGDAKVAEVGRQRIAEQRAAAVMRRFGGPIDIAPSEALLDTVKWTAGYVAWLRDKVAAVESDRELVWAVTQRKRGASRSVTSEACTNAWLVLLGDWHDKLVRVCAEAIRAGIEERRVRLAEAQGALVADVIRKILGDLDLTPEQATKAGESVPRRLRLLAG